MTFLPTKEHFRREFRKTPPGRLARRVLLARAERHRRSLTETRFVAVTGSSAKTTTKELIAAVLSTQLRGTKTPDTTNAAASAARTILGTRPSDDFCVVEAAAWEPGSITATTQLVRPDIAVVTTIGREHFKALRTPEDSAAEKRTLVEGAGRMAVLNADDPLVLAMGEGFRGEVVTFGESPDATVRAADVHGTWPERLSLTVTHGGRTLPVSTRFCGTYWTTSVLAALAVGLALDVPLEAGIAAVEAFEPLPGRMSPVVCDGITFVRDDRKAPIWSLPLALGFVADAEAERKVVVLGTISDYPGAAGKVYRRVARQALEVADEVVFVGPQSARVEKAQKRAPEAPLRVCPTVRDATEYLSATLRSGDLVLLKGSIADHLARIILARTETIRCWRQRCGRAISCEVCWLRGVPGGP